MLGHISGFANANLNYLQCRAHGMKIQLLKCGRRLIAGRSQTTAFGKLRTDRIASLISNAGAEFPDDSSREGRLESSAVWSHEWWRKGGKLLPSSQVTGAGRYGTLCIAAARARHTDACRSCR